MAKLVFNIKGPFQAYGSNAESTFLDFKPTRFKPQKSHIIGMIGAGLRLKREKLSELEKQLHLKVIPKKSNIKIYHDFQVVCPRGTDFSTKKLYRVIDKKKGTVKYETALEYAGLIKKPRPEDKTKLPSADGGVSSTGESKIIKKDYLMDAEFIIEVTGEKEILEEVRQGLMHPYYPLFLGRKNCIATKIEVEEIQ